MNRRLDKLHLYICLFSAVLMTAVCLVKNETLYMMSVYVSVTIVAFYFIGHFVRFYIVSKIFPKPIEDDAEDTDGLNRMDDPVFTDTYETEEIS